MEDGFIDFYFERNIPNQLSHEGPCSDMADVNGDGLMDIFIGGAADQAGQLYINTGKTFVKSQSAYFEKFKAMEDTAAHFFDADGDGDPDLLVGSGGNNVQYDKRAFTDRLYINTDGRFELRFNALPRDANNTSVIRSFDYDLDGDLDVFIGARSTPGLYGISPGSKLYNNNGKGQFIDVTEYVVPELKLAGMMTDAVVADVLPVEGDELILVGEWMSPKVLAFNGQNFEVMSTQMDSLSGWWQSVNAFDADNDGDMDLVLGNIGENFYLEADNDRPIRMWINDFDKNGSLEKLITRTIDGRDMPVVMKRDMTDQLASLKKQNLKHTEYARKSIHELFDPEVLKTSTVKQINFMSSIIAYNKGAGAFEISHLPVEAQLSCINEILIMDFDADNDSDIILAGNNHYFLPQFSMLDACKGVGLLNDGKGQFNYVSEQQTGLYLDGVVRALESYELSDGSYILALRNNDKPLSYKLIKS